MNEEKKITFAETDRIDEHAQIAGEVMHVLFGLRPGEYFISDGSYLYDFVGIEENEAEAMNQFWNRILGAFGISQEDVKSNSLADIFDSVAHRRNLQ